MSYNSAYASSTQITASDGRKFGAPTIFSEVSGSSGCGSTCWYTTPTCASGWTATKPSSGYYISATSRSYANNGARTCYRTSDIKCSTYGYTYSSALDSSYFVCSATTISGTNGLVCYTCSHARCAISPVSSINTTYFTTASASDNQGSLGTRYRCTGRTTNTEASQPNSKYFVYGTASCSYQGGNANSCATMYGYRCSGRATGTYASGVNTGYFNTSTSSCAGVGTSIYPETCKTNYCASPNTTYFNTEGDTKRITCKTETSVKSPYCSSQPNTTYFKSETYSGTCNTSKKAYKTTGCKTSVDTACIKNYSSTSSSCGGTTYTCLYGGTPKTCEDLGYSSSSNNHGCNSSGYKRTNSTAVTVCGKTCYYVGSDEACSCADLGYTATKPSVTTSSCNKFSTMTAKTNETCYYNISNVTSSKPADSQSWSESQKCRVSQSCSASCSDTYTDSASCTKSESCSASCSDSYTDSASCTKSESCSAGCSDSYSDSASCTGSSSCDYVMSSSTSCNCDGTLVVTNTFPGTKSGSGTKYRTCTKSGTKYGTKSCSGTKYRTCTKSGTKWGTKSCSGTKYRTCTKSGTQDGTQYADGIQYRTASQTRDVWCDINGGGWKNGPWRATSRTGWGTCSRTGDWESCGSYGSCNYSSTSCNGYGSCNCTLGSCGSYGSCSYSSTSCNDYGSCNCTLGSCGSYGSCSYSSTSCNDYGNCTNISYGSCTKNANSSPTTTTSGCSKSALSSCQKCSSGTRVAKTCTDGGYVSSCNAGQTGTTVTYCGLSCKKCTANDTCPTGYTKGLKASSCTGECEVYSATSNTPAGSTCGKCLKTGHDVGVVLQLSHNGNQGYVAAHHGYGGTSGTDTVNVTFSGRIADRATGGSCVVTTFGFQSRNQSQDYVVGTLSNCYNDLQVYSSTWYLNGTPVTPNASSYKSIDGKCLKLDLSIRK